MGNFSEVAFSEVKEVKTNVSVLVIYWFQNTYFIHFIRLAPIFKIGVFWRTRRTQSTRSALTSNF